GGFFRGGGLFSRGAGDFKRGGPPGFFSRRFPGHFPLLGFGGLPFYAGCGVSFHFYWGHWALASSFFHFPSRARKLHQRNRDLNRQHSDQRLLRSTNRSRPR